MPEMRTKTMLYSAVVITAILLVIAVAIFSRDRYYEGRDYAWYADFGSKEGKLLVRGRKIDRIKKDINKLICALNKSEKDPETFRTPEGREPTDPPKLKLTGITGQVATIAVINDEHLTQRMGTTGAEVFLAVATFTLTEHEGISHVNFIFEEGDHAAPGLYSREHFLETWKISK
jgi:hypothetical protein